VATVSASAATGREALDVAEPGRATLPAAELAVTERERRETAPSVMADLPAPPLPVLAQQRITSLKTIITATMDPRWLRHFQRPPWLVTLLSGGRARMPLPLPPPLLLSATTVVSLLPLLLPLLLEEREGTEAESVASVMATVLPGAIEARASRVATPRMP
jgi:hypothetical protein